MDIEAASKAISTIFVIVLALSLPAIYLILPAHNGKFTRAFRDTFGAFSLIMFQSAFRRLGGWEAFGVSEFNQHIVRDATYFLAIITVPRTVIVAYIARKYYQSEVARLAKETHDAAKLAEQLAAATRQAASDKRLAELERDPE